MSLSVVPGHPIQVRDDVINLQKDFEFAVYNCGEEVMFNQFQSVTNPGTAFTITCNPPSIDSIMDPENLFIEVLYNLSFAGTGVSGQNLIQAQQDAPRSFPISNTIQTIEAKIGNESSSTQLRRYFDALIRCNTEYQQYENDYSMTPSYPDQYSEYGYTGASFANILGDARNPLGNYGSNVRVQPRGSFNGLTMLTNTQTSATATLLCTERLFLSPFIDNKKGLVGIANMNMSFNFANLSQIWSRNANHTAGPLSSLTVSIQQVTLRFRYIKSKLLQNIPREIAYNYHSIDLISSTNTDAIPAGSTGAVQVQMQAVNLSAVPQHLLIFAREQDSDFINSSTGYTKTDTFANITTMSINFGQKQAILANATEAQIYDMCRRNGVNISWDQWRGVKYMAGATGYNLPAGGVGSVALLKVGRDIPLDSMTSPSELKNPLLSGYVNIKNINPSRSIVYTLFVYAIYAGVFVVKDGSCYKNPAPLSSEDVVKTLNSDVFVSARPSENLVGGDWWDDVKRVASDVYKGVKQIGSDVAPFAEKALPLAKLLMTGLGRKRRGRGKIGGINLLGGKKITRAALKRKLGGGLSEEDDECFEYSNEEEYNSKVMDIAKELQGLADEGVDISKYFTK